MSYRDTVLYAALAELSAPICWSNNEARILDYFKASTGQAWTKDLALEVSWCSYFVHWCLVRAAVAPTPLVGASGQLGALNSISRFMKSKGGVYQDHAVNLRDYAPRPGDMYYKPNPSNHIGFISDVRDLGAKRYEIDTVDGNSGPDGYSALYDTSGKIGKGFIYNHTRQLTTDCFYIELCDDD